jgi:hypothetical protein
VHDLGDRRAIFPVDPTGGGTWIGANDAGLVVGLLNRHSGLAGKTGRHGRPLHSRGSIVVNVLRHRSLEAALDATDDLDPANFGPFFLAIVHEPFVALVTSDGRSLVRHAAAALRRPLLLTSSSLGDHVVDPPRRQLFERMMAGPPGTWLDAQTRFHQHQWLHMPEISVRMEREEAMTVSGTTVDVGNAQCRVWYEPLAPVGALRESDGTRASEVDGCCS